MKDKRIWIVIGCILVIGTGVTHYTKYYVNSQGAAMMAEITAGAEETAASSFAPALGQLDTETGGADAGMAAGRAAPATPPAMADAAEETMASDTAGSAGAGEGAAVSETASEKDMPISPLTGARTREYKASRIVDYRKRLEDLDTQILKMREETELKLWEGELNSIYNALMEMLSQEDAAKLASEQQEWLKNRDARAAESSGRNSGSMEGISYAAALVSLTRDRAYELAGRYEEANGVFYEDEDSSQTALP